MSIRRSTQILSTRAGSSRQLRPLSAQADQDPQPRPLGKRPRLDSKDRVLLASGSQDPEVKEEGPHDLGWWENSYKRLSMQLDILIRENIRLKANATDTDRTVIGLQGAVAQLELEAEEFHSEKEQLLQWNQDLEDEVEKLTDEERRLLKVLETQKHEITTLKDDDERMHDIMADLRADVASLRS
ncbi:hypothetical protein JAAARDRAFT_201109 [Jaapia argillacea MUCL 33604]|uniref:Uncharacterized protein n=1 Tax=Jaapia argillacea MUCL 33604 TaxID=933084 RepID=A0A067P5N7_9AGAM|nr:hypothetical protein JAAARDRAFT_201109 [Jaapia argillacea MUCL 33604]